MAIIKRRLNYNDPSGEMISLYLETSSDMVVRDDGTTVEDSIQATETALGTVDTRINSAVSTAKTALVDGAPTDANTLKKLNTLIQAVSTAVGVLNAEAGDGSVKGIVSAEVGKLTAGAPSDMDTFKEVATALATLTQALNTLQANGGEGSIKQMISDAIALVVADAPESLDTLKELATWIQQHDTDATAMNNRITANANNITALTTRMSSAETAVGQVDTKISSAVSTAQTDLVGGAPTTANTLKKLNDLITALTTRVAAVETKQSEYTLVAL